MEDRIKGKITGVLHSGVYFVTDEDQKEYVFFWREVNFKPKMGREVTFVPGEPTDGGKYPHAMDVERVKSDTMTREEAIGILRSLIGTSLESGCDRIQLTISEATGIMEIIKLTENRQ